MAVPIATYYVGADLPDLWVSWRDAARHLIQFDTDTHTYTLVLARAATPGTIALTKTTGFAAYDTDPNLIVQWQTTSDLNALAPGTYLGEITAKRVADNRERVLPFRIDLRRRLGA